MHLQRHKVSAPSSETLGSALLSDGNAPLAALELDVQSKASWLTGTVDAFSPSSRPSLFCTPLGLRVQALSSFPQTSPGSPRDVGSEDRVVQRCKMPMWSSLPRLVSAIAKLRRKNLGRRYLPGLACRLVHASTPWEKRLAPRVRSTPQTLIKSAT